MQTDHPLAPPWRITRWLNTPSPITLEALRGRVVVLHAFQMLCPSCVAHGLPQAMRIREVFPEDAVCVVGLHTVFEHHEVMNFEALKAFVQEYRLNFPIGIDQPAGQNTVPLTMQAYGLQGTPSLVLIDKGGRVRLNHFGRVNDLVVGAAIGQLIEEGRSRDAEFSSGSKSQSFSGTTPCQCTDEACPASSSRVSTDV